MKVFGDFGCAGQPLASGQASPSGDFNIVTPVTHNATTVLTANTTDAADHTSDCSSSITYTHDNQAPAPPWSVTTARSRLPTTGRFKLRERPPAGPPFRSSRKAQRLVSSELAAVRRIVPRTLRTPGLRSRLRTTSTTQIAVTATDAANNTSSCAGGGEYVEDSQAPSPTEPDRNRPRLAKQRQQPQAAGHRRSRFLHRGLHVCRLHDGTRSKQQHAIPRSADPASRSTSAPTRPRISGLQRRTPPAMCRLVRDPSPMSRTRLLLRIRRVSQRRP